METITKKKKRKIERVALIDVYNFPKWRYSTHKMIEPLGIECVGALLERKGYEVRIFQQQNLSDDQFLEEIISFSPDVAGFTSYSFNFKDAVRLAEKLKKRVDVITVFGGYHVSFVLEEVRKNPAIDFIIRGEGEYAMLELLEALNRGDLQSLEHNNEQNSNMVNGIAYFDGKKIRLIKFKRILDLDSLPFAMRDERILRHNRMNGLMYPPPSKQVNPALIFSSRGCPFTCTYCVSPNFLGTKVGYRDPSKVVDEMEYLVRKYGTNTFYFTDLTFNLRKDHIVKLANEIIRRNLDINWYAMFRPNDLDRDTIKLLKMSGCSKIYFGIDSLSEEILRKVKRNIKVYKLYDVLSLVWESGIIVRGSLMIGLPWDTLQLYSETLEFIKELPIDEIRVSIFSPYPGTEFFEKNKEDILSFDYEFYNSQTPLVKSNVSPKDIYEFLRRFYREFYNSRQYAERMREKIRRFPELEESYKEFWQELVVTDFYSYSSNVSILKTIF